MNQGVLQSSFVQQMMAAAATDHPNHWWPNHHHHLTSFIKPPPSPPSSTTNNFEPPPNGPNNIFDNNNFSQPDDNNHHHYFLEQQHQQFPVESWSQLLMGGDQDQGRKKIENWENEVVNLKHEQKSVNTHNHNNNNNTNHVYAGHGDQEQQEHFVTPTNQFYQHRQQHVHQSNEMNNNIIIPISSPQSSCVTSFNNPMLDFSPDPKSTTLRASTPSSHPAHPSECNSAISGGIIYKKAKVQPSSTQSTGFKVRKEKLGDRVTALHQLVSPFGKTDTASVLLEVIGYIRFLHNQIEALSIPYLSNAAGNKMRQPHHVEGEGRCIFPEDPGQLLNDNCLKRKAAPPHKDNCCEDETSSKDAAELRSRGLCLVPMSLTLQVLVGCSDNGADYWAPPPLHGGFRHADY